MAKRKKVAKTLQIPKKIGTAVKRKRRRVSKKNPKILLAVKRKRKRVSKKNPKILLKELGVASNLK